MHTQWHISKGSGRRVRNEQTKEICRKGRKLSFSGKNCKKMKAETNGRHGKSIEVKEKRNTYIQKIKIQKEL